MDFLATYGIFLAKTVTVLAAILIVMAVGVANATKGKKSEKGTIKVTHLNDEYDELTDAIEEVILDPAVFKLREKAEKKKDKEEHKQKKKAAKEKANKAKNVASEAEELDDSKKRLYVLDFNGDPEASQVEQLRLSITAILSVVRPEIDEILLRLESPGGLVHAYGLAASQLNRIRNQNVTLTICIDKVAASGGYMMACLGSKIVAAPFAYIGSIGVVLQMPNFYRLLQDNKIDYETITGGEYKRTLTTFGENTDKAREKVREEIQDTHTLFKDYVKDNRPSLNISEVATGETWFGSKALEKNLIDEVKTSDECILEACKDADVYLVSFEQKKNLKDKLGSILEMAMNNTIKKWLYSSTDKNQYMS